MLARRLRRLLNIKTTLGQCLLLAEMLHMKILNKIFFLNNGIIHHTKVISEL